MKLLPDSKSRVHMVKGERAVVLTPFPWELNATQNFKLLRVPEYFTEENIEQTIWKCL